MDFDLTQNSSLSLSTSFESPVLVLKLVTPNSSVVSVWALKFSYSVQKMLMYSPLLRVQYKKF